MRRRAQTFSSPLFRKILVSAFLLVTAMGGAADFLITRYTGQHELEHVRQSLSLAARIFRRQLATLPESALESWAAEADRLSACRVTIIALDGGVLADSRRDRSMLENHARRPEFLSALRGVPGVAIRRSASVGLDLFYLATPAALSSGTPVILRLAAPLDPIQAALRANRRRILFASLLIACAALFAAYLFTRSFARRIQDIQRLAEDVAAQRLTEPPPLPERGNDELGALAASLHRMASRLLDMVDLLRSESARRDTILSSMREGVLAVDSSLHITFSNGAFLQAIGARHPPVENAPLASVAGDPSLAALLQQVICSGEAVRTRHTPAAAPARSYELYAKPLEMNRQRGALAIFHDVTEIERLERVRRDFVANVSHELRTPLTAIRGYAETLLDGAIDDPAHNRNFLEVIRSNAIRLTNIASDLLVLSELEQHRPVQETAEPVPLQPVIDSAVRTVESAARLRRVALSANPAPFSVLALRFRLEQALVNLLDNAVKFSPPGSEVRVESAATAGGMVEIQVIDHGIGIPPEDLPRIFERFYRVDKARSREAGGTGLGLSIVKHIAELFGGAVRVESQPGHGSTFTISFPVAPAGR